MKEKWRKEKASRGRGISTDSYDLEPFAAASDEFFL